MSPPHWAALTRGRLLAILLLHLLAGCGAVVTFADVQRTAQARGCWPNRPAYPTPPPVTVTPALTLSPTPAGFVWPTGFPSPTHFPTTTPYPRCPAAPGCTDATSCVATPWPTPVPPPPYPTMSDSRAGGGSGLKTTLQLPEVILTTDIAVHPTAGWPAVAAAVWSGNANPERAFVSVLNPQTRTWTPAHQVDLGAAALGRYQRTIEVAITGDGVVHAVWGMSDPDFTDNDPPAGVWAAESRDYGASWSAPQRVGADCRQVNDLAATLDGWLVAGLICNAGDDTVQPAIATRSPAGTWTLDRLPGAVWSFSDGAVAIAEDGAQAWATVAFLTAPNGAMAPPPRILIFRRALGDPAPWALAARDLTIPGVEPGPRTWHAHALAYRPAGAATDAITLAVADAERGQIYALTSPDAGRRWLAPELVAAPQAAGERLAFPAPAYDAATNRLLALFTCCMVGGWDDAAPSTHLLRWSTPGSGAWADPTPGRRIPLILGARSSGETVVAQARNARSAWVAWVEGGKAVEVRSLDFATVP